MISRRLTSIFRGLDWKNVSLARLGLPFALIFLYIARVLEPNVFMTGNDFPGHVLASLRLHETSFFPLIRESLSDYYQSFPAQVLRFNHGYTTLLVPYIFYELFFNLFNLQLIEANLLYIHSFFGILSLISIYLFLREISDARIALWSVLVIGLTPLHIGLSRVHVGTQIFQSATFFLSCYLLIRLLKEDTSIRRILFGSSLLLYLGSDNAFPIGFLLFAMLIYFYSPKPSLKDFISQIRHVFFDLRVWPFFVFPTLFYVAFDLMSYLRLGQDAGGYLLRLISKGDVDGVASMDLFKTFRWGIDLIGPAFLLGIVGLFYQLLNPKRVRREHCILFSMFVLYSLIFTLSHHVERNYVFFLLVPTIFGLVITFIRLRSILFVALAATAFYSMNFIYSVPEYLNFGVNFGSVHKEVLNNDYGIKALGYLVRNGDLDTGVSRSPRPGIDYPRLNIFLDYSASEYYLGERVHDWPKIHFKEGALKNYKNALFVYRLKGSRSDANDFVLDFAKNQDLHLVADIRRNEQALLQIYSTQKEEFRSYQIEELNAKFDSKFATIDAIARIDLGHF